MTKKISRIFCLLSGVCLLFASSCTKVSDQIEPKIDYALQDRYLLQLPSPFSSLSLLEEEEAWAKEYRIAICFAKDLDLYQAITAFKRASYLIPPKERSRKMELDYEVLLCYYIGKKYQEAIYTFENSPLAFADPSFPAHQDLLVILFDSYLHTNDRTKADKVLEYLQNYYPSIAEKLQLSLDLQEANIPAIEQFSTKPEYDYLKNLLNGYSASKKSVSKAQMLNTLMPGAGYFYLGQRQSALTAFLLNGLFIGASYYFFANGNIPAGVIFTGFEAGWYFGGIYGAGEEAKFYNERVYERYVTPLMNQKKLFPALTLQYAF